MLCYAVVCSAVQCCAVQCCALLCCSVLCSAVLTAPCPVCADPEAPLQRQCVRRSLRCFCSGVRGVPAPELPHPPPLRQEQRAGAASECVRLGLGWGRQGCAWGTAHTCQGLAAFCSQHRAAFCSALLCWAGFDTRQMLALPDRCQ